MSNRRKLRRTSPALAAHDGLMVERDACCRIRVEVHPAGVRVHHDLGCPGLDPSTPEGKAARGLANLAAAYAVAEATGTTVAVLT